MKWTFLGTWVPAAPLNIAMVQILQGHNPSFVGDLLGRKVKLVPVPILNEGTEKQTQKEVRTFGDVHGVIPLFSLFNNLF